MTNLTQVVRSPVGVLLIRPARPVRAEQPRHLSDDKHGTLPHLYDWHHPTLLDIIYHLCLTYMLLIMPAIIHLRTHCGEAGLPRMISRYTDLLELISVMLYI